MKKKRITTLLPPTYDQCMIEVAAKRVTCRASADQRYQVFNYAENVEFDDSWNDVNIWCRGMVFDVGCTPPRCVAVPMKKFWNVGQRPETSPEALAALGDPVDVREKIDGCCDGDTVILTDKGEMTIREVCESDFIGKVLSFNVDTQSQEYKDVLNTSIISQTDNWFELELDDGTKVHLTGNHRVWLPQMLCYRRVDELNGDEQILLAQN